MKIFRIIALLFSICFSLTAQNVPPLINYQGRLAKPDGSALSTANYELTFRIYDSAQNGNLLWGPQIFDGTAGMGHGSQIPVVNGYFNVMLGPVDTNGNSLAGAFAGTNCYVEITVTNNSPISPRQRILTTPFAFQAGYAAVAGNVASGVSITNAALNGLVTLPTNPVINTGTNILLSGNAPAGNFFFGPGSGGQTTTGGANTAFGVDAFSNNTTGFSDVAVGNGALWRNTTGNDNTAVGAVALTFNTTGTDNTAIGKGAGFDNTTGSFNTAMGSQAFYNNSSGSNNTAVGFESLYLNTNGFNNTATGYVALFNNTSGYENTADGSQALNDNTTGYFNTAVGVATLYANTTGFYNTAVGVGALGANSAGAANVAVGMQALTANTTGGDNAAIGMSALMSNSTGNANVAAGARALFSASNGLYNTALGYQSLYSNTVGSYNIALGSSAGQNVTTGNNNIEIGNQGTANDNNTIYLGTQGTQTNTIIAGISGAMITAGLPVYVNSSGQLGNQTVKQTGTNVGLGGVAISPSCGSFGSPTPSSQTAIPNFNVTITTQGNPVEISFANDGGTYTSGSEFGFGSNGNPPSMILLLYRDQTLVATEYASATPGTSALWLPPGSFRFIDTPSAAIHNYSVQIYNPGSATGVSVLHMIMMAREL